MAFVTFRTRKSRRALEGAARSDGVAARSLPVKDGPLGRFFGEKMLRIGADDLSRVLRRNDGIVDPADVRAVYAENDEENIRLRELRPGHLELANVQPPELLDRS